MHCNCHSLVHRALVTYADEKTGEIRVRVPAVTGLGEMTLSKIARKSHNNVWVVPNVGEQIIVSADDENMTNLFWIHSDVEENSSHYRNYFEAYDTTTQSLSIAGNKTNMTYNTVVFSEGIRLVEGSKITFDYDGVYNLQYSIQWNNTDSQAHESVVWIGYNDIDYANSSTYVTVPSKHGSFNGTAVTSINFVGQAFAGDYIELHWTVANTAVTIKTINSGTVAGITSEAPTAPGVIVTVTQVA